MTRRHALVTLLALFLTGCSMRRKAGGESVAPYTPPAPEGATETPQCDWGRYWNSEIKRCVRIPE
jgi:PBP1b-binding outer membrane lipoprotein LpoB